MGEESMRVTFVGAVIVLIVAVIVIAILDAMFNQGNGGSDQKNIGSQ
jgi:hypothetical protein